VSVVLGLNEFFHDTAAALVIDGKLAALIEQERLDRRKHAEGFALLGPPPWEAIHWCLQRAGIDYTDIDVIAVSFDADALRALGMLADLVRGNLRRTSLRRTLAHRTRLDDPALNFVGGLTAGMARRKLFLGKLSRLCDAPVTTINHHLAHAASAFYPSGVERAGVIVLDGMGDASPTSIWEARGDVLRLREMVPSPFDSLGVLYRTISLALGFGFMDAGKTMGLAAYGAPRPAFQEMLVVKEEQYRIDWSLVRRLSVEHGRLSGDLQDVHKDLAASLQAQLERTGVALARRAKALSESRHICMAGGVALNCNMNSRIQLQADVADVFVQPGAMDMGCALGAALAAASQRGDPIERGFSVYSGPAFADGEIELALRDRGLRYERVADPAAAAADLLAERRIIGWFQDRMEFGPRALGARSILAHPARLETRDRVNRVKRRESWRPLAPAILEERLSDWMDGTERSPYMTFTYRFHDHQAARVPAVVHVDGTARVQSVASTDLPIFHALIEQFEQRTGIPIVLNTSFNDRGEPIVCTPAQAVSTFVRCGLDALVIGPFVALHPGEG